MSITINRTDEYVDYNVSAPSNRGYLTIDTSSWIDKPWMFYELPALKFEIYTETDGELVKYQNFSREIRTYNPVYSPLGVLNVTIDIRNVPEEFILRITPIFDNDAISARNMLIENGIESGDIWGSDQDVPTQSFDLDIEFIECDGEYIPPVQPTHEETITGIPPITFDGSTGEPLVSWTILGNSSKSVTPTPDNPVMPDFVGVRTGNMLYSSISQTVGSTLSVKQFVGVESFILNKSVSQNDTSATVSLDITLEAGSYTLSVMGLNRFDTDYDRIFIRNDGGTIIAQNCQTNRPITFTLTEETHINRMTFVAAPLSTYSNSEVSIMLNTGSTALPYEPFGYKIPITLAGQTQTVYLGQTQTVRRIKKLVFDGTENWFFFSGVNIWQFYTNNSRLGGIARSSAMSNIAPYGATAEDRQYHEFGCYTVSAGQDIAFQMTGSKNTFTDIDAWKAYLAQQYAAGTPVTIWYVLATPQTGIVNEPLAKIGDYADELHSTDAAVTIPTAKGSNTLTVDTELQPSEMMITYIKEGQ